MEGITVKWLLCLYLSIYLTLNFVSSTYNPGSKKTYIVHVDVSSIPPAFTHHIDWYSSLLKSVAAVSPQEIDEEEEQSVVMYTYQSSFHGMAVRLTQEEAEKLESQNGVVGVLPEVKYKLHTTRSPLFLGLEPQDTTSVWSEKLADHDVVVGVLDTGIWPESPSFNDTGFTAVPAHWKGACEVGRGFQKHHCNKKIVGARSFYRGYEAAAGRINEEREHKSARDEDGHGTHTAATVAGSPVHGANLLGYAYGTARGMSPGARIAVYKVCWKGGCFSSDILAAVDAAVEDGVNVMSISLGGGVSSYHRDSLSIAAFGAMEKGVFISCSAGNGGPDPVSLTNVSPWITTVGASTMDRDFPGSVKLGSGVTLKGVSLYKGRRNLSPKLMYPLVYTGANSSSPDPGSLCLEGTLDPHTVSGKIVICDRGISPRVQKGEVVKQAGGVGMILSNTAANGEELVADCHLLPAVAVGEKEGKTIKQYAMRGRHPTGNLAFYGTKLGIRPSPVVAAFSSRGPNFISLEIMKPDLVAPGVNILAAWTGDTGPSSLETDQRRVGFNILSGTSMSCPHVSGVAALLKARHPEWSPAAIKSALMTTAYIHDNNHKPLIDSSTGGPSGPYDHGAGHINPVRAVDPGLIYDIGAQNYFDFLCTQGLTQTQLVVFAKFSNRTCRHTLSGPSDLNYPAISVVFPEDKRVSAVKIHRTVTNVGPPSSNYHVVISQFKGVDVKVEPSVLTFSKTYQKLSYEVTLTTKVRQTAPESGALIWKDGVHRVRSPVVITWLSPI
ncbi:hypothetical protein SSX86_002117 [Deinandra increscens subsp. villosa]|uniref:Subtilisin-like protease n=1 Tax=Deinandra increscens subsp. villosa TaxID=3103831 RepID=A0AAP0HCU1_9ASTR